MAEREGRGVADVTGVGARGGITGGQRRGERGIGNRSGPPSVADALKPAVPARRRHPDFDLDVGVARWLQRRCHTAERRQAAKRGDRPGGRAACWRGRHERAGIDYLRKP